MDFKRTNKKLKEEEVEHKLKDPELISRVDNICKDKNPFQHIQALNYPRMAGTQETKKAIGYVETTFKSYGLEPKVEEFYLPERKLSSKLVMPLFFIAWGIFSYINVLLIPAVLGSILGIIVLLVPIFVVLMIFKLELLFKKMIKKNYQRILDLTKQIEEGNYNRPIKTGRNIYAEYVPQGSSQEHLYITAHIDSTTLKISTKWLKLLLIMGVLSGAIYLLSYLIHYLLLWFINYSLFSNYSLIFFIILMIFLVSMGTALLSRIFRTNKSHGAIDDLTGVAVILELAALLSQIQPKQKITLIIFGAEEVGLMGSSYHYYTHENDEVNEKTRVISIDMIGEIPPLVLINKIKPIFSLPLEPEFNELMQELAQKLGVEVRLRSFLYPSSDFACWFLNGHPANYLMNPSKFIHTPQDTAENVNQNLLKDCLKLLTAYLSEK